MLVQLLLSVPLLQAPEHLCPNCHIITRCNVGAIHSCATCTVNFRCHTLLCQISGALLVPYIVVHSVRSHVGAIYSCAICTVHYCCHTLLCQFYGALFVPYIGVPFVCSVELFYCCQCAVLLKHVVHCSELSCLSVSTVLLSAVLFHLTF